MERKENIERQLLSDESIQKSYEIWRKEGYSVEARLRHRLFSENDAFYKRLREIENLLETPWVTVGEYAVQAPVPQEKRDLHFIKLTAFFNEDVFLGNFIAIADRAIKSYEWNEFLDFIEKCSSAQKWFLDQPPLKYIPLPSLVNDRAFQSPRCTLGEILRPLCNFDSHSFIPRAYDLDIEVVKAGPCQYMAQQTLNARYDYFHSFLKPHINYFCLRNPSLLNNGVWLIGFEGIINKSSNVQKLLLLIMICQSTPCRNQILSFINPSPSIRFNPKAVTLCDALVHPVRRAANELAAGCSAVNDALLMFSLDIAGLVASYLWSPLKEHINKQLYCTPDPRGDLDERITSTIMTNAFEQYKKRKQTKVVDADTLKVVEAATLETVDSETSDIRSLCPWL